MMAKSVVLLAAVFGLYGLILTGGLSLLAMWACCIGMGVAMAGIGFSIGHDAQHGAYSSRPGVNTLLGLSFELLGANGYMWRLTHNLIHHTYTQIHGMDEDVEVSPLLRLSPGSKHRWGQRFQYLYAPFAYSLSLLNWAFVKDYDYFLRHRLGPYEGKGHPRSAWAGLAVGKLFHYALWLALPIVVLPMAWWQVLLGYVTAQLVAGLILGVVFQLAHVVESTSYPSPEAGGLNFQIEHHLFPKTCSVHYPAMSAIVRRVARQHGLPYHVTPTFTGAVRSHWRMLRRLGDGAGFAAIAQVSAR